MAYSFYIMKVSMFELFMKVWPAIVSTDFLLCGCIRGSMWTSGLSSSSVSKFSAPGSHIFSPHDFFGSYVMKKWLGFTITSSIEFWILFFCCVVVLEVACLHLDYHPLAYLNFQPLDHAFSRRMIFRVLCNGGMIGIHNRPMDQILDNLQRIRPSIIGATPL